MLDQLISLYRIFIRSRKWTLRLIMHCIDLALTNSRIEYKNDCNLAGVPHKDILHLLHFRMRVAEGLVKVGGNVEMKKRGRPSSTPPMKAKRYKEKRPADDVQYDYVDRVSNFDMNKEATRCKMHQCGGRTHIYCDKCNVHLCLTRNKNCFAQFHRK